MKTGDLLISIDGMDIRHKSYEEIVKYLEGAEIVKLRCQRSSE